MQTAVRPLKVCPHCGLEAYSEEDLEQFKLNKWCLHGRESRCKKCFYTLYGAKQIDFQGRKILFKENPRTNVCSECGRSYPGELKKQTFVHHEFYDSNNPLAGTVELCNSCHTALHHRKGTL